MQDDPDTGRRHRWPWVAGWTLLGTAIPGTGLIAAGYRRFGALLVFITVLGVAAVGMFLLRGDLLVRTVRLGTDPRTLLVGTAVVAVGALLLIGIVVLTNTALWRRSAPHGRGARFANVLLVGALVALIGLPAGGGTYNLLVTRHTLLEVFGDGDSSGRGPASAQDDPWAGVPRVNVLLIGSDHEEDRKGTRTDTMIVASIDTETGDTVLLSPPRNLQRVPFARGSRARKAWPYGFGNSTGAPWRRGAGACGAACDLSAVWSWGEENARTYYRREDNPGAAAVREAIEGAFALQIDATVVVNLDGFKAVIDALGGLVLDVHERLPIGGTTERPITGKWIEKGMNQRLDGYEALWFARSRSLSSDYDRMRRQRCVIAAMVDQADPFSLAKAYPSLMRTAGDNITTDIPLRDIPAWTELSAKVKEARIRSLPFTNKVITYASPDYREIRRLVRAALTEEPEPEPTATATPEPTSDDVVTGAEKPRKRKKATPAPTEEPDPTRPQDVKDVC